MSKDWSLSFKQSMKKTAKGAETIICDDMAIAQKTTLEALLQVKTKEGWEKYGEYNHPAIGRVIQLRYTKDQ